MSDPFRMSVEELRLHYEATRLNLLELAVLTRDDCLYDNSSPIDAIEMVRGVALRAWLEGLRLVCGETDFDTEETWLIAFEEWWDALGREQSQ